MWLNNVRRLIASPVNRELPVEIYSEVIRLSSVGDELADAGDHIGAVRQFQQAVALLPSPVEKWNAATWLFTAIGDSFFLSGDLDSALVALNRAQLCPDALNNPFVWLRRGQIYYEVGDTRLADDCLASAYMLGGTEIFDREDQKYADYILAKLKLPANANKPRHGRVCSPPCS